MDGAADPDLQKAIDAMAPPGVLLGHRLIRAGDEGALLAEEAQSIASPLAGVRRASGAARIAARELLARLGHPACALPRMASGAPLWPAGLVGSLAHDDRVAVAAVARRADAEALGIDVEPAEPLPADMLDIVATAKEQTQLRLGDDPRAGRLLFAAKEAVYKAVFPLDGVFREFHDITVDLAAAQARAGAGRVLALRFAHAGRIVALALAPSRAAA